MGGSYCWFPLGLTSLISLVSKGLSQVFSSTTVQNIISSVLSFLYSPSLTFIHDYWKNHSFDYMDPEIHQIQIQNQVKQDDLLKKKPRRNAP